MVCDMMDRHTWYITPTLLSHGEKLHHLRAHIRKSITRTYAVLDRIGALEDKFLNVILIDMLQPLLTEEQANLVVSKSIIVLYFMLCETR
jgi:hypothetical protein